MQELKTIIYTMFGFMWTQPIHATLRQMRFIQVGLIINSQFLLWEIVGMIKELDQQQAAIALGAIAAALIAQIWAAVQSIQKSNEKDG